VRGEGEVSETGAKLSNRWTKSRELRPRAVNSGPQAPRWFASLYFHFAAATGGQIQIYRKELRRKVLFFFFLFRAATCCNQEGEQD